MEADTIENIWHHTKCIDLLKGQKIIEIDSECSVSEGCEVNIFEGLIINFFILFHFILLCFRFWLKMEYHLLQFSMNV
jgi:hypothetical protein